ncbi:MULTISPECIES: hypothetical protein [Pseudoalteromonas]|uniref:Uncharacterized protein n=1 Tax=Pseudoalteromonas amylolytica TaxID=1859457 RepID=A0A1S1MQ90_9GAMM|nr:MULTISPECIES: hypothetical protein [Pseudoalteromonas]OHU84251.1 hypothetical protein BFC16_00965 [Pseudoalteromonas sp. JW3]OHU87208.1 hypothetical protein BET10_00970 [Pseudoalteromonas amylolytica]
MIKRLFILLITLGLAACGGGSSEQPKSTPSSESTTPTQPDTSGESSDEDQIKIVEIGAPTEVNERDTITIQPTVEAQNIENVFYIWEQTDGPLINIPHADKDAQSLEIVVPSIFEDTTLSFKLIVGGDNVPNTITTFDIKVNAYPDLDLERITDENLHDCIYFRNLYYPVPAAVDAHIKVLECEYYDIKSLAGISQIVGLEQLTIRNAKLEDISELINVPTLNTLELEYATADGADTATLITQLEQLSQLSSLTITNLNSTDISCSNINFDKLSRLDTLKLSRCGESETNGVVISDQTLSKLKTLVLKSVQLSDDTDLSKAIALRGLYLSYSNIYDYSFLEALTNLRAFGLEEDTSFDMRVFPAHSKLKYLHFIDVQLTHTNTAAALTNLEHITLVNVEVNSIDFLAGYQKLKIAQLYANTGITSLAPLLHTKELNMLEIVQSNHIDFSVIQEMTSLTYLLTRSGSLGEKSSIDTNWLAGLPNLAFVDIDPEFFDGNAFNGLQTMHQISITANTISSLPNLSTMPLVTKLELEADNQQHNISSLQALGKNEVIRTLKLAGLKDLTDLTGLEQLTSLVSLTLKDLSVSDLSAIAKLEELDFISITGAEELFNVDVFAQLPRLTYLEIHNSKITCEDEEKLRNLDIEIISLRNECVSSKEN